LNASLLEAALVDIFPSFGARFEAAHAMARGFTQAEADLNFPYSGYRKNTAVLDSTTSVFLLISTEHHMVMSPIAGGPPAEKEWSCRFPCATVVNVKSNHLTIPYAAETGWCVVHFLGDLCGLALKPDAVKTGQRKFVEINEVMEAARQSFRMAWKNSKYAEIDFRLKALKIECGVPEPDTELEKNILSTSLPPGMAGIRILLAQIGAKSYIDMFDAQGYDDAIFLASLDRIKLDSVLRKSIGMSQNETMNLIEALAKHFTD